VAKIICGVDVSSFSLEACIGPEGPTRSFPNTADGIAELTIFCRQHGVELVAMEATGGYEKQPLALLWARGLPVALLNPRAVRRFAEGMGLLEKTDRIDAGVIAWFAAVKRSVPCTLVSAEQDQLKALVTRLRQLTELQTAQRNQRLLVSEATVLASFREVLALVASQIRTFETAIAALIAADPLWQKLDQAFRSIKGVADRTVARLMGSWRISLRYGSISSLSSNFRTALITCSEMEPAGTLRTSLKLSKSSTRLSNPKPEIGGVDICQSLSCSKYTEMKGRLRPPIP